MTSPGAKTSKAKKALPDAATPKKPVKPHRYDRRSVKEYEDEGLDQAINFFSRLDGRFRNGTTKGSLVRAAIDGLDPQIVLQATMSDFWLQLTRAEGQFRRRTSPPSSPFVKVGTYLKAEKGKIADWDAAWRVEDVVRVFTKSGAAQVRSLGALIKAKLPWLMTENGSVIGCTVELPIAKFEQAMQQPSTLGVEWMTVEKALLGRWVDGEEQSVWLARLESAMRKLVAELEANLMRQNHEREAR